MPNSERWEELSRLISELRQQFLPPRFDPLGAYPDPNLVQAHTRAFLVLSHAEIESYLEDWAKDIARTCEIEWTNSSKITEPFTFLLVTLAERIEAPSTLIGPKAKDSPQRLGEVSKRVFEKYYKRIKENHGIKEKNVLELLAPLGVPAAALGSTLLPNLDSLGALRGAHAHQSAKVVQNTLDPETEHIKVVNLVKELTVLDAWLVECKRRILQ